VEGGESKRKKKHENEKERKKIEVNLCPTTPSQDELYFKIRSR